MYTSTMGVASTLREHLWRKPRTQLGVCFSNKVSLTGLWQSQSDPTGLNLCVAVWGLFSKHFYDTECQAIAHAWPTAETTCSCLRGERGEKNLHGHSGWAGCAAHAQTHTHTQVGSGAVVMMRSWVIFSSQIKYSCVNTGLRYKQVKGHLIIASG